METYNMRAPYNFPLYPFIWKCCIVRYFIYTIDSSIKGAPEIFTLKRTNSGAIVITMYNMTRKSIMIVFLTNKNWKQTTRKVFMQNKKLYSIFYDNIWKSWKVHLKILTHPHLFFEWKEPYSVAIYMFCLNCSF